MKKIISIMIMLFLIAGNMVFAYEVDSIVTIGANLSNEQKEEVLTYFNVSNEKVIEITNEEEKKYLSHIIDQSQIGNASISSSYIKLSKEGSGLDVKAKNLTFVTEGMIKNALLTSGVEDITVIAYAPYEVSGTASFLGVAKGLSELGINIDKTQIDTANEEVIVTAKLGEVIGSDKAIAIVNDIKAKVIELSPSENEIKAIIEEVSSEYKYDLNKEEESNLIHLMSDINSLNLDYEALKDDLNEIGSSIKEVLGINDETGGFVGLLQRIVTWFEELFYNLDTFFDFLKPDEQPEDTTDTLIAKKDRTVFFNV